MKFEVQQTQTFAEEVRRSCLRLLALEFDQSNRLSDEIADLKRRLDYDSRDPMEQIMIEQVLTAHTQNLISMYQLENLPINTNNTRQRKYLEERVRSTHFRLCRSMGMLTALRLVGPRLQMRDVPLPASGGIKKKFDTKDVPNENVHPIWPADPTDWHWSEYKDPKKKAEAIAHNEDIRKWMEHREAHRELYADDPPHLFVEVVRKPLELPKESL